MKWLKRWFSFSWKKLVLVATLVPLMWFFYGLDFPKVDMFSRDVLQFLNDNSNVEKSIVTINMNLKNEQFKRPFEFESFKTVVDILLKQNPKNLILCFSPREFAGDDTHEDIRQKVFDYLLPLKNVYLYSQSSNDKHDPNTDRIFEKFPRIFLLTMSFDNSGGRKHRRAIVWFETVGIATEFAEMQKLGFQTKSHTDFPYGWHYWKTIQPYIKTFKQDSFGSHDAYEVINTNFKDVNVEEKTVILGSIDEFAMLGTESIFNLYSKIGTPGYKDFPPADSLANYMNFYIHGDYIKLISNFNDLILFGFVLIILIFINIETRKKLYILLSLIPLIAISTLILYVVDSYYINFSRSIAALFFIQYLGIPIIMFAMFKEQETKKLQEISDARIDALLTVSEKVAHDIRSPLSAINLIMHKANFDDAEYKEIFDTAVQRIDETATKILTRYRTKTGTENEPVELIDLAEIISSITKEKKILNIKVEFELVINSETTTALGLKLDLERIISNILDNSIFALQSILEPRIFISIDSHDNMIRIGITDNGVGIPDQVLKLLGTTRITTKADTNQGNGIGILHAKRVIERLTGRFEISSAEHVGTTIKISLPKA